QARIDELGPWFHNLHLDGVQTAPEHPFGNFPAFKWEQIAPHIDADLSGRTVLDIGCNAGFYSFELARRGARVTAIDMDPHYLRQARWAAEHLQLSDRIDFRQMQVYDLAREQEQYDLVWFMGVLYHLRHPLLALDIIRRRSRGQLVIQTMTMPGEEVVMPPADLDMDQRECLLEPGWPAMAFIEHRLAGDPTNWWAPNHACVEAMLRSAGFSHLARIAHETYLCRPDEGGDGCRDMIEDELRAATGT
ncbi:MAG: TIGR04290 family methyltransferase, partial [Lysobacter spongiicola]|nr:TIGR04290 family methyltransferase [Lysobacter spongiicola]